MNTIELIKKMKDAERGIATVAIANAEVRKTKTQKDFLSLAFVDKTGTIQAKIWDWNTSNGEVLPGTVWKIKFEYSPYQGSPQIVVRDFKEVPIENVDKGLFIDSLTQEEFRFYNEELKTLIGQIGDKALREFVHATIFKVFPEYLSSVGAKSNHHARLGGLLQHSVRVTRNAQSMANAYKGTPTYDLIDMDLIIAAGLLHDLSKIGSYTTEGMIIDQSLEGTLTRHYDTGPAYLMKSYLEQNEPISNKRMLALVHIMVTHHGIERSEQPPSTISAWIIHCSDLADCFIDALENHMDGMVSNDKLWLIKNKVIDERELV